MNKHSGVKSAILTFEMYSLLELKDENTPEKWKHKIY